MLGASVNRRFLEKNINAVASGKTLVHRCKLYDDAGDLAGAADLVSLTLSVLDETGAIVNSVDGQDILDNDRGEFDTGTGQLVITLLDDDTQLPEGVTHGIRSLLIQWEFGAGKTGGHQVYFKIVALG